MTVALVPFPRRASARRRRAFALLGLVQATLIFTITVVSVPLPTIGRELGLGRSELVLVSAAYALSFSGLLLFGGRLTDRYGGRRMLVLGLLIFAGASAVAAFAPQYATLVGARFGQGIGAALIAPAATSVLRRIFPDPAGYHHAMVRWGGLSVLGATAGIVLAGIACTWASWRWMFVLPVFVATLALLLTARLVPRAPRSTVDRPRLDLPAAILATAGVTLLSYSLVITDEHAWSSPEVLLPLGAALILLGAFVLVEVAGRTPLLPMSFLANRQRVIALLAIGLSAAGSSVICLLLALYLQQVQGWSPLRTSVAFVPYAISLIVMGRIGRRPIERYGAPAVIATGLALAAAGFLHLAALAPGTDYVTGLLPGLVLLPAGVALAFSGSTVLAMADVTPRQAGLAGGMMNTAMEVGPTVGVALLMAVAAARTTHVASTDTGGAGGGVGLGDAVDVATTSGYGWAFGAAGLAFAFLAVATLAVTSREVAPREEPSFSLREAAA
ncbi:MFS transporter [Phytohabitans rumicis]|uniref:MFS transporter n=1 Tax=Phytohabitans rumicis TaxID=1076125 RepID=A0A6V8LCG9_9ACTN|nr:MFS transporter [Phytohabitans rumicis]GFJ94923.1 MFS transporter [Phytohabitans rumicis]